jgi:molybdate transport system substrate-binding protein
MRAWTSVVGLLSLVLAVPIRSEEILVFAAASLTESLQEIGKSYSTRTGTAVQFSFGASSDLARQIEGGAPAGVFFSADTAKTDALEKAGLVRHQDRREFLSNRLAVVATSDSKRHVGGARDLLQFSKIALADPAGVPAGIYARKWLESAGVWKEIVSRVVPTLDVRAALAAVESGGVEAAIVYSTDAKISKKVRVLYETSGDPAILYSVASLARGGKAAADFVAFLQGKEAEAVFSRAGFVVMSKR